MLTMFVINFSPGSPQQLHAYPLRAGRDFNPSGAPNENIVQNHLNIALLNVFYHLNGRYRHIFIH